ncbi:hypothetical protein [Acidithiobacillus thiooxidans]|uniref:Uncharacterized protein n=1 Tax=Acidithiobacillus thiooxidans ATCC 19377 TaxID=637390 RepID=A0A543PZQ0_ACITH|nr:hypothetical protein [Acidithiobacillus thiooxidans]MDX5935862.1 hypothetical protein [Acidithiobacillus thiooxidans]TQN49542.1 hypothetical protein DLNHIDIE_03193 [Acidithiobacillus thiooxidans ATCC 19377]
MIEPVKVSSTLCASLALLAVRKRAWSFERLGHELGVEATLIRKSWQHLLENAWRQFPEERLSKHAWQPDASIKAMIALAAYRYGSGQMAAVARQYGVPVQRVRYWRRILLSRAAQVF